MQNWKFLHPLCQTFGSYCVLQIEHFGASGLDRYSLLCAVNSAVGSTCLYLLYLVWVVGYF